MHELGLLSGVVEVIVDAAAGRRVRRTVYRPDPWAIDEWAVSACGVAAAVTLIVVGSIDPAGLHPSLTPLAWPTVSWAAVAGIAIGALPAWLAPPVQQRDARRVVQVAG